jgi:hypothetical protein
MTVQEIASGIESNMAELRQSRNLALEIGLYRIALVVNGVLKHMKKRPALATLFDVSESFSGKVNRDLG